MESENIGNSFGERYIFLNVEKWVLSFKVDVCYRQAEIGLTYSALGPLTNNLAPCWWVFAVCKASGWTIGHSLMLDATLV